MIVILTAEEGIGIAMDKEINQLQPAGNLDLNDMIPVKKGTALETEAKRATIEQLVTLIGNVIATNIIAKNVAYMGAARPGANPGVINRPAWWTATEAGVYPNFGGVEVEAGTIAIISFNGSTWSADTIPALNLPTSIDQTFIRL